MTGGDGRLCGLGEGTLNKTKPNPFLFEVCLRDCGLGKVFNKFFICKMGKIAMVYILLAARVPKTEQAIKRPRYY